MIVFDTNLLIYAHRAETPENRPAQRAINEALSKGRCAVALSSLTEFWTIVTHPMPGKRSSTAAEARTFIANFKKDGPLSVLIPGGGFDERLLELAHSLDIRGVGIFDLQIALLAVENGAREIWTHDRNFIQLPGLKVYDPI